MQTKAAKSMVGLSLSVDSSQSLTAAEFLKRRGSSLSHMSYSFSSLTLPSSFQISMCYLFVDFFFPLFSQ